MATVAQLMKQQEAIAKEIEAAKAAEVETVKARMLEIADKSGFSLADLGLREKRKINLGEPYVNPKDPSQSWSGRGRAPEWFTKAGMKKRARPAAKK
jgi:DNA-binding protein H-NS